MAVGIKHTHTQKQKTKNKNKNRNIGLLEPFDKYLLKFKNFLFVT